MIERIILVENSLEAMEVQSILKEADIPFRFKQNENSAFPGMFSRWWGEIAFPNEYSQEFFELTNVQYASYEKEISENTGKLGSFSYTKLLLVCYAILSTLFCYKYYNIYKKSNQNKNFHTEWNYDNTIVTYRSKKTNAIAIQYSDINMDNNFERITEYSDNQNLLFESLDLNEDGYYEILNNYDPEGNLIEQYIDSDFDHWYDEGFIIFDNGDTLKLLDKNRNGIFDSPK